MESSRMVIMQRKFPGRRDCCRENDCGGDGDRNMGCGEADLSSVIFRTARRDLKQELTRIRSQAGYSSWLGLNQLPAKRQRRRARTRRHG